MGIDGRGFLEDRSKGRDGSEQAAGLDPPPASGKVFKITEAQELQRITEAWFAKLAPRTSKRGEGGSTKGEMHLEEADAAVVEGDGAAVRGHEERPRVHHAGEVVAQQQ